MKRAPKHKQTDSGQALLDQLLATQPRPSRRLIRPPRTQAILAFLSHGAWQGVGTIFGFLSLVVTIILTIYVFDLGREQGTANMHVSVPPFSPEMNDLQKRSISFFVRNNGPATGRGVFVVVTSEVDIECKSTDSFAFSAQELQPTRVTNSPRRCEFFYDYFYSNNSSYLQILASTVERSDTPPLSIFISGENVIGSVGR